MFLDYGNIREIHWLVNSDDCWRDAERGESWKTVYDIAMVQREEGVKMRGGRRPKIDELSSGDIRDSMSEERMCSSKLLMSKQGHVEM